MTIGDFYDAYLVLDSVFEKFARQLVHIGCLITWNTDAAEFLGESASKLTANLAINRLDVSGNHGSNDLDVEVTVSAGGGEAMKWGEPTAVSVIVESDMSDYRANVFADGPTARLVRDLKMSWHSALVDYTDRLEYFLIENLQLAKSHLMRIREGFAAEHVMAAPEARRMAGRGVGVAGLSATNCQDSVGDITASLLSYLRENRSLLNDWGWNGRIGYGSPRSGGTLSFTLSVGDSHAAFYFRGGDSASVRMSRLKSLTEEGRAIECKMDTDDIASTFEKLLMDVDRFCNHRKSEILRDA